MSAIFLLLCPFAWLHSRRLRLQISPSSLGLDFSKQRTAFEPKRTMSLPPLAMLTPGNNGPAVITVAYALIITTILFTIVRVVTTFALKRKFGYDDGLLVAAVVIGLAQSIITEKSAVFGLGRHFDRLSAHQLDLYYKVRSICFP